MACPEILSHPCPVVKWQWQPGGSSSYLGCTQPFSSCWTQRTLLGWVGHSGECRTPILCQLTLFSKRKTREREKESVPNISVMSLGILGEAWGAEWLWLCKVGVLVHSCSQPKAVDEVEPWSSSSGIQKTAPEFILQQPWKGGNGYCLLSL